MIKKRISVSSSYLETETKEEVSCSEKSFRYLQIILYKHIEISYNECTHVNRYYQVEQHLTKRYPFILVNKETQKFLRKCALSVDDTSYVWYNGIRHWVMEMLYYIRSHNMSTLPSLLPLEECRGNRSPILLLRPSGIHPPQVTPCPGEFL